MMASIAHDFGARKEKGSVRSTALWDDCFFNHVTQSVSCFDFLRWRRSSSPCAISTIARMSVPARAPISSILDSACNASSRLESNLSSPFSFSIRRDISPRMAVTINPALLSLTCLTDSIDSITSCGTRTVVNCDLAFLFGVAINETPEDRCVSVYTKKEIQKGLTCVSLMGNVKHTNGKLSNTKDNALKCTNTKRAFNQNVIGANTMAYQHSTQTRPKFQYRFLALSRSDMGAKPCRVSVEALTEHDARMVLAPYFILSLAARLPAQEVCHA